MQVYRINENGVYIEPVVLRKGQEIPSDCIALIPPNGLYRAKWTGTEWMEDMSQEEIDELNNQPREKTQLEILQETVDMLVLDSLGEI